MSAEVCDNCGGAFFIPGQNSDLIQDGCPNCGRPFRDQPSPTVSDMQLRDMPGVGGTGDDTGGNPLQEGILADNGWKNRRVRDESYASWSMADRKLAEHFDIPFETVELHTPSPSSIEAQHTVTLRIPHGITDNLHKAFGKTKAWVENPYENGQLRPYYNGYWKTLRPALSGQAVVRVGIQDPHMAKELQDIANAGMEHEGGFLLDALPAIAGGAKNLLGGVPIVGGLMRSLMGGGGQEQAQGQPQQQEQPHDFSFYGAYGDDFESPSSKDAPHSEGDGSQDGDSKQRDDGDKDLKGQVGFGVNDDGGSATGDEKIMFDPEGHGFQSLLSMLPHLLELFHSGQDASGDPLVQSLHKSLDAEHPGYLEKGDPVKAHEVIMMIGQPQHKQANPVMTPMPTTGPNLVQPGMPQPGMQPAMAGHCPNGHTISPADKQCPQCGMPVAGAPNMGLNALAHNFLMGPVGPEEEALQSRNWPNEGALEQCPNCGTVTKMALGGCPHCNAQVHEYDRVASVGIGPHTDEQKAAVADFLQSSGRGDEIPTMLLQPEQYADELAEIQNKQGPPDADGLNGNPPEQAVEQTPPGAGMPVPPMQAPSQQMMAAILRHGADSVANVCPKCDSHTTRLLNQDGESKCHNCGELFKTEVISDDATHTSNELRDQHQNHPDVSAADFLQPENVEEEQDSGHAWADQDGEPLHTGSEYEMYSDKYDIPDIIRVDSVKPDAITYTLTGEYGLEHKTEVSHQEALMDGISFKKIDGQAAIGPEDTGIEQNMDSEFQTAPGEQSDLSQPHMMQSNTVFGPDSDWANSYRDLGRAMVGYNCPHCGQEASPDAQNKLVCPNCGPFDPNTRTAGAHFTPMEQREFIDEPGEARNKDKLNLEGTHYVSSLDDQFLW